MRFLVDVNLPPRLCDWLLIRGHKAEHLANENLLTATDTEVWDRARAQAAIIASKDFDFYDRSLVLGAPP